MAVAVGALGAGAPRSRPGGAWTSSWVFGCLRWPWLLLPAWRGCCVRVAASLSACLPFLPPGLSVLWMFASR